MREFIRKIETKKGKIRKSYASIYSDKIKWRIILPKEVYTKLEDSLLTNEPNFKFNNEIALYYLSLISSLPSFKKDKTYPGGYVNLSSKMLHKANYNYKKYFDYFLDNDILEKNNSYSNYAGQNFSKSYRYNLKGIKDLTWHIFEIDVLKSFYKKINVKEKKKCDEPLFLNKWLNSRLRINSEAIFSEIQSKLKYIKPEENRVKKKAENYLRSFKNLNYNEFWSSRNLKSDKRFHSNLTNMPKFFRKYITYNFESLAGVDIKNSQPFFLIILIECIINRGIKISDNNIFRIMNDVGYVGTMFKTLSESLDNREFQEEYKEIKLNILNGTFYDNLAEKFKFKKEDGKYKRRFYNKDTNSTLLYEFDNKRNLMKKLILFFFYKSNKKKDDDYLRFKSFYPRFCNVLEMLKQNNKEDLPRLLQHLEADCIIDYTCSKISNKYPNLPLFTIHDSIITTEGNIDLLKLEVRKHIKNYCNNVQPSLEVEYWTESKIISNTA